MAETAPGWSGTEAPRIDVLPGGVVAPLTVFDLAGGGRKGSFDGGAYFADGSLCATGEQIKSNYKNLPPATIVTPEEIIPGRHVFGGMLQNRHFGHFMAESLTRMWALQQLGEDWRSVVFTLRSPERPIASFVPQVLEELAPGVEVRFPTQVTRFESLAVPQQLGERNSGFIYGHPAVREMIAGVHQRRSGGPERVFISRSQLGGGEGGVLLEKTIERNLEREGYVTVHPQALSIAQQMDIYSAAKDLVFTDGSALHLFALLARPDQRVFIIWRRKKSLTFLRQIQSFGGALAVGDPCIRRMWTPGVGYGAGVRTQAELDFDDLRRQLTAGGFVVGTDWEAPSDEDAAADLARIQARSKDVFVEKPWP